MAKVLTPLMSADAKGSVGGITYSRCSSGNVAKYKARPVKRSEKYKMSNRARVGFLARSWGALTQGMRDSWKAWAEDHPEPDGFGGTFIMSGINAYLKLNFNAMRMGGAAAREDMPPVDECPASMNELFAVTGVIAPGDIDVTWTHNGTGVAGDFNEIQIAGPFISPGRKEVYNRFAYITHTGGNVLLVTIEDLDEGMWYWVRGRYLDMYGQVSAWLYAQATPMLTI